MKCIGAQRLDGRWPSFGFTFEDDQFVHTIKINSHGAAAKESKTEKDEYYNSLPNTGIWKREWF